MEREPEATDEGPREWSSICLQGARLLVVDDEVIVGMELQAILEDNGAEIVVLLHTLAEALEHAADGEISAAVLDIRLGRDSVDPLAKVLFGRGIPFLFYSGQSTSDRVRSAWPQAAFISKPARSGLLVDGVLALLTSARSAGTT